MPAPLRIAEVAPEPPPRIVRDLHMLTITPFYPTDEDDACGCFVSEPIEFLRDERIESSVLALKPLHRGLRSPNQSSLNTRWARYLCFPGNAGLASSGGFAYRQLRRQVARLVKVRHIRLIHAHAPLPCGHIAYLIHRELGLPYVVSIHGLDVFSTRQVKGSCGERCRRTTSMVLEGAMRVICVSRHVEMTVKSECRCASTTVVYNGVKPDLFFAKPHESEDGPVLISVANLIEIKDHALVLQAIAHLKDRFPQLQYKIVGNGPERKRLMRLAAELGILDRVHFLGRRTRRDVADLLRSATVFVLPSRFEALGCVYLEAMCTGTPVIACRGQGIEEIVQSGDNGFLVDPGSSAQLVDCLELLLSDKSLRVRIGQRGRETVLRELTLSHQAARLARIYRECVN